MKAILLFSLLFAFSTGITIQQSLKKSALAKKLDADYITWYVSAAVMQIPEIHKKIQKTSF